MTTHEQIMRQIEVTGKQDERVTRLVAQEVARAVVETAEAICLLIDEIELKDYNATLEQWKQYKHIRNAIRDKYVLKILKGEK